MKEFFDELLNGKISFDDVKLIILGLSQAGIFATLIAVALKVKRYWNIFKKVNKDNTEKAIKELIKKIDTMEENTKKLLLQYTVKTSNSLEDLKELLDNLQDDNIVEEDVKNKLVDKITNIETKTANKQNQTQALDELLKEEL